MKTKPLLLPGSLNPGRAPPAARSLCRGLIHRAGRRPETLCGNAYPAVEPNTRQLFISAHECQLGFYCCRLALILGKRETWFLLKFRRAALGTFLTGSRVKAPITITLWVYLAHRIKFSTSRTDELELERNLADNNRPDIVEVGYPTAAIHSSNQVQFVAPSIPRVPAQPHKPQWAPDYQPRSSGDRASSP